MVSVNCHQYLDRKFPTTLTFYISYGNCILGYGLWTREVSAWLFDLSFWLDVGLSLTFPHFDNCFECKWDGRNWEWLRSDQDPGWTLNRSFVADEWRYELDFTGPAGTTPDLGKYTWHCEWQIWHSEKNDQNQAHRICKFAYQTTGYDRIGWRYGL